MQKTITTQTFKGPIDTTLKLVDHGDWSAILVVKQDGKSMQNKWGGYNVRNTGKTDYIKKIWKNLS